MISQNKNLLILDAGQYGVMAKETAEAMGVFECIVFLDDSFIPLDKTRCKKRSGAFYEQNVVDAIYIYKPVVVGSKLYTLFFKRGL